MKKPVIVPHGEVFDNALSVSQIITYLKCRRAWKYSYLDKITKKYDRPYLTKGKLAHSGMQAAMWCKHNWEETFSGPCPIEDMVAAGKRSINTEFEQYVVELGVDFKNPKDEETMALCVDLNEMRIESLVVFERTLIEFGPDKWSVEIVQGFPAIELHYALPIRGMHVMHGFIDLVAWEIATNQIWEIDWKFKSQLAPGEDEQFGLQHSAYCRALLLAGVNLTGSITFQSLNIMPTEPNINKNGTISRAKIRITWDDYAKFCLQNGQDPELYREEMEPKLAETEWTRITREYRSDFMMNNIWHNVVQSTALEISSKRKGKRYPPTIGPMNCKSCSYMPLCQAELRGYDMEYILNTEYVSKVKVEEIESDV